MRVRCAAWGGVSLGIGTLAFALCGPSTAGCSTNLVVLTHSAVTARGCAAFSVLARIGVGLMVLGAVLLLGSFVLAVRIRRPAPAARPGSGGTEPGPRRPLIGACSPRGVATSAPTRAGRADPSGGGRSGVGRVRTRPVVPRRAGAAAARVVRQPGEPGQAGPVVGRDQAHRPAFSPRALSPAEGPAQDTLTVNFCLSCTPAAAVTGIGVVVISWVVAPV